MSAVALAASGPCWSVSAENTTTLCSLNVIVCVCVCVCVGGGGVDVL